MGDVVDFKDKNDPHISGPAKCVGCGHRWTAVTPVGSVQNLECPACTLDRGMLIHSVSLAGPVWVCECGNDLMQFTGGGVICVGCGYFFSLAVLAERFGNG